MTDEIEKLAREMEAFCASTGITPQVLSRRVAGTSSFYARIKAGGDCTFGTAAKIRAYMAEHAVAK